jgi:hypothetical protein
MTKAMNQQDQDRLELLDRIEKRAPEIELEKYELSWETLEDSHEALLVDGAEYFANCGEDLQAYGSLAPIMDGHIGCIVIKPDGSRYVAQAVPDPLAGQPD